MSRSPRSDGRSAREWGPIRGVVVANGGYVPLPRRRSPRVLSLSEREEISRGLAEGASLREIARRLGRAPSTVSREVARHGGRRRYRATRADERAWRRALRPKPCKLAAEPRLRALVAAQARRRLVAGADLRLACAHLRGRAGSAGVHRDDLPQPLRPGPRRARARSSPRTCARRRTHAPREARRSRKGQGRGGIADAVSIRERPPEVEDRAVPGHWEGDLLAGSANTHIATLVERQTRFLLLVKLERQGHRDGGRRPRGAGAGAAGAAAREPHLGPRHGARRAPALQRRHRRRRLLLRPALALAAGHEREHQRAAAPVLPEEGTTSPSTPRTTSTPSPHASTAGHARRLPSRPRLIGLPPLLRRLSGVPQGPLRDHLGVAVVGRPAQRLENGVQGDVEPDPALHCLAPARRRSRRPGPARPCPAARSRRSSIP